MLRAIHIPLVLLAVLACGCARYSPAPRKTEDLDQLLTLMQQRLALMHDVARWKWNEKRPIADPQRERELLDRLGTDGQDIGLRQGVVRPFFIAQIEAAREVQQDDFHTWQKNGQGKFEEVVPLPELRRRIDEMNVKLLAALPGLPTHSDEEVQRRASKILVGEGIDEKVRQMAIKPLLGRAESPR